MMQLLRQDMLKHAGQRYSSPKTNSGVMLFSSEDLPLSSNIERLETSFYFYCKANHLRLFHLTC